MSDKAMTTNQTIDGVPRASLELLLGDTPDHPSAAWKELRALLDAPCPFPGYPPVPEDRKMPATQPQGEPVAMHERHCMILDPEEPSVECTCNHRFMSLADDPRRCADCDAVEVIPGQPAPVAVALPERREIDEGASDADQHSDYGWNACIDELKRLNPSPKKVRMCDCNQGRLPCNGECKP